MRRFSFVRAAPVACLMFNASSLFAGTIRDDVPDQSYLSLATQPQYAAVGRIDFTQAANGFLASGTLINNSWVLTAAHVVSGSQNFKFTIGGVSYTGDSAVAAPGWDGNVSNGNDIGLVHLSSPVATITPATRETSGSDLNAVATYVGFGKTGTGFDGATTLDLKERAVQNVVDSVDTHAVMLADFDSPHDKSGDYSSNVYGSSTPLALEGSTAPGDSGGGVFVDRGGSTYLAGVVSYGSNGYNGVLASYGSINGADEVTPFNAWIDSVIAPAAVPEPASLGLLAVGGLGLLRRRKDQPLSRN